MNLLIEDPTPDDRDIRIVVTECTRDYTVTFVDGTEQTFAGITRAPLGASVLSLYRREKPSAAEEHVASLSLANVRMWVKTP